MRRPPRKWFYGMVKRVKKSHPGISTQRAAKLVAGIWYKKLSEGQRHAIVRAAEIAAPREVAAAREVRAHV